VTRAAATAAATLTQPATLNLSTDAAGHTSADLYLGPTRVASVPSPVQEKQLAQINAGLSMVQTLDSLHHWGQMGDVSRLSSVVGLATNYNTLSGGALGDLSKLGTVASALSLFQAAHDGNVAGIISGINAVSGGQIDLALNSALGTASSVPYVSIALALNDFDKHVGQSVGTLVGVWLGGSVGGAIGSIVGGALDDMFGGSHRPPPPPEGAVHFSWDAAGQIQHTIDRDERGGGGAANQVAAGVQSLLEQVVHAANASHTDPTQDLAINPYLLPRFGVSKGATWMEVTLPDGSTLREDISQAGFAEHLITILQDNGALAPAWQVATVQGHWAQAQASHQPIDHALTAGIGGHAYAGNEAYSLQGNATESADFKTQDFGVLVVHIAPHIAQHAGVQASA